jgi:hypothetical protein
MSSLPADGKTIRAVLERVLHERADDRNARRHRR